MSEPVWSRRLVGGFDGVTELLEECRHAAQVHEVPAGTQRDVIVALEEIVTNALRHGGHDGRPPVIEASLQIRDTTLILVVFDDGLAFNPLAVDEPPRDLPLEARPIGGLGILLFRRLMDGATYARVGDRNRLELRKRFDRVP